MPALSIISRLRRELADKANRGFALGSALAVLLLVIWNFRAASENPPPKPAPAKATQTATDAARAKAPPPPAEVKKSDEKIPDPEDLTLTTSDGVRLILTYYRSNKGREAVPVVLLHASGGSRTDYKDLAASLQSQGFAVVVPDLRGHGDSTRQKLDGNDYTLKAAKLPIDQYRMMVEKDMYAVKEFLWDRNNAKELNLNKLCVLGAEMGASVAMNFTAIDALGYGESDRGASYGPLQLGRFVKALVLLSPEFSFKGLPLAMQHIRRDLPVLIIVGKRDAKSFNEAERVAKIFKRPKPKNIEDTTYFFNELDTTLQGTKLLEPKALNADRMIGQFLRLRLIQADQAREWTWKQLKKPHEDG
jgi:alpha-beta hydrolase superfamily lysophospholipase